ncbi:MAG TPA: hypothetical protein VF546_00835 [Pyrinomonadaceae bacterium]|jgi:hypothetical protein
MFCPHCGAGPQRPESYCTRCGEWLADPNADARLLFGPRGLRRVRTPEQKSRAVLFINALDSLLAFAIFVVMWQIKGYANADFAVALAMVLSIVIAVQQLLSLKFNLDLRKRLRRGREEAGQAAVAATDEPRALGAGEATQYVPPPSVTEQTTELLERARREPGGRR